MTSKLMEKSLSNSWKTQLAFTMLVASSAVFCCNGLSSSKTTTRRAECQSPLPKNLARRIFFSSCVMFYPMATQAASPPSIRSVDVGGGVDMLMDARISEKDVLFPISMEGLWVCERLVTQVEGDNFQAEAAWRGFGGAASLKPNHFESFQTRFQRSPFFGDSGVVSDRGFEISSRTGSKDVSWNVEVPDTLMYGSRMLKVVQRSVELPSDKGFGFNELVRIDDGPIIRAAQIKRRYRRAFDETGARIVEGLEIMKTFRVLDGVAGTELPTSVTKSQITLRRP